MRRYPLASLWLAVALPACSGASSPATEHATEHATGEAAETRPAPAIREAAPSASPGTVAAGHGTPVGDPAPSAALVGVDGAAIEMSALYAQGPVLLVFYRGGWCPYCNFQLRQLTEEYREFLARGVTVVAVSVDRFEEGAYTSHSWDIPFAVLSDSELSLHRAFGVLNELGPEEVARLQEHGVDLEARSGDRTHHTIAIPSAFLIVDGLVRWAHVEEDHRVRPSVEQLLTAIDAVLGAGA